MKTWIVAFAAGVVLACVGMSRLPVQDPPQAEIRAQRFVLCDAEGRERGLFEINDWLGGPCLMLLRRDGQPHAWIGLMRGSSGEDGSAASIHLESEPGDAVITLGTDSMVSIIDVSADDRREVLLRADADQSVLRLGRLDYHSLEPQDDNSIELESATGMPNGARFEIKDASGEVAVRLPR